MEQVGRPVKSLASVCVSWVGCQQKDCFVICSDRSTMYSMLPANSLKTKVGSIKIGTTLNCTPEVASKRQNKSSIANKPFSHPQQCATALAVVGAPMSQPDNKLSKAHNLGVHSNRCWSDRGWGSAYLLQEMPVLLFVRILEFIGSKAH